MITSSNLQSVHQMVLPTAGFNSPALQNFMVSFSGVAVVEDFHGLSNGDWHKEVLFIPSSAMQMNKVIAKVRNLLSPPVPPIPPNQWAYGFVPLQWTVNASINSTFNKNVSTNAGFELDDLKISRPEGRLLGLPGPVKVLDGFLMDISVRDIDGAIQKVAYEMNLYGYFVPYRIPPI